MSVHQDDPRNPSYCDLDVFQSEVKGWAYRNFGTPDVSPSYRPLLGAMEELGELAHAHLKGEQGIRHTPEEIADKKLDAVGDILVYLADYANREGISLYAALERAWGEVKHRDWLKNQQSGRVEKIEVS